MSRRTQRAETRRGWRTVLVAVLALLAVIAVRPPHAPPLYDGLGQPDEPYRWVSPPAGSAATSPATTMTLRVDLFGTGQAIGATAENGPQLKVSVAPNALAAPPGATLITLTGTPAAAPPPPDHGTIVSNLYRWTAAADRPGLVTATSGTRLLANLRADQATDQAVVFERWDGAHWAQLTTRRVGVDIYAAFLVDLQPVALVRLDRGVLPSSATGPSGAAGSAGSAGGGAGSAAGQGTAAGSGALAGQVGGDTPQSGLGSGPVAGLWIGFGVVVLLLSAGLLLARRRAARQPDQPAGHE